MSGQLKQIFLKRVRNELFTYLMSGPLQDWDSQTVIGIIDEAINVNMQQINSYLYNTNVMLLNMDEHIKAIIDEILLPYLNQKRVL